MTTRRIVMRRLRSVFLLALVVCAVAVLFLRSQKHSPGPDILLNAAYSFDMPLPASFQVPEDLAPPSRGNPPADRRPGRIYLVCADGLCWKVLRTLLDEGKLPAITKLIDGASLGRVRPDHATSIINWMSLATGSTPAEHGITWNERDPNPYSRTPSDVKRPRLWEVLAGAGKTVGIANWFLTEGKDLPPGSYLYLDDGSLTLPDALAGFPGEEADPVMLSLDHAGVKAYLRDAHPTDFYVTLIDKLDKTQHRSLHSFFEARQKNAGELPAYVQAAAKEIESDYSTFDRWMAPLVERLNRDAVFLVSESGARPAWPQRNISLDPDFQKRLVAAFPGAKIAATASMAEIDAGRKIRILMPLVVLNAKDFRAKPDWPRELIETRPAPFVEVLETQALLRLAPEWQGKLAGETGAVYLSPSFEALEKFLHNDGAFYETWLRAQPMEGTHAEKELGVIIANGPGTRGLALGDVELRSIAPTILEVMGVPVPGTMSGKPLW